ncbi:cytochrome P450 2K4-like [Narcine bancroftii]|uniref:cytochrome P450 2K4-like n=1 Tax=Narcine bancroftii TaxID=1343680 RepID=UPI003831EAC9
MAVTMLELPALSTSSALLLCALLAMLLVYLKAKKGSGGHYPPGPRGLPFIGNMHQLDLRRLHLCLMEISEKYGKIFSLRMGQQNTVVLMGYELVKEALVGHAEEFMGRHKSKIIKMTRGNHGIIMAEGNSWKQMRRFTISTLRDFGMGKRSIEERIIEEALHLRNLIQSFGGQPFETTIPMNCTVANVICCIVLGKRFKYEDETFVSLIKLVNENVQLVASPQVQLYNAFPLLGYLPGTHRKVFKNIYRVHSFLRSFLKENRQSLKEDDIRSFIDVFMMKQEEETGNSGTYFHEDNLLQTTNDLFVAGMETTSTTIRWALLVMAKMPHIQKKVQDEIDAVLGRERYPQLDDRKHLPYTDAVIHETQRFANIVPLNLPHETTTDVNFRGYLIPKGTQIIPSLTSVLRDKSYWERPEEFYPMHFLDKDGNFVRRDAFIPFSAGRRSCAGESLAKAELFLFFTALLQAFTFQIPAGTEAPDLEAVVGITLAPKPHKLCAMLR